jgi:FADH2-dependent halogenase
MPEYDVLIIGGGPGGSSAATFLARAGKRVLVLEKEHFPRFHIGESLLPYNQQLFEEMGVLPALQAAGFPRKFGAQFHLGSGTQALKLVFRNGKFTRVPDTFQVERSKFDDILLRHAQKSGAEVREGWTVNRFSSGPDQVMVQARGENGQAQTLTASFLIDASGRGNVTGNQEGLRVIHPRLKKLAVFGHFEAVRLDDGPPGGDTVIVRLDNKWFWIIPISATKMSVGCVMDKDEFSRSEESPAGLFEQLWKSNSVMRERMKDAKLVNSIQTTSDFSYYNRRFVGHRLLRIGDAAGFMDPIFSAGVYLAMHSGKEAAKAVLTALAAGTDGRAGLKQYEKRFYHAMWLYWEMVEGYYTTTFIELFLQPRGRLKIPDAIVALLAGELEGGWALKWRRWLFFFLVKMQAYWPVVPRFSFAEVDATETIEDEKAESLAR